jgi:hypothetical protein
MSFLSISDRIRHFIRESDASLTPADKNAADAQIQAIALDLIHDPKIPQRDREEGLALLRRAFVNTYKLSDARLYVNLLHRKDDPAGPCRPYPKNFCDPFIASYNMGDATSSLIARVSFDLCKKVIPKEIIDALTKDLSSDQIQVFFNVGSKSALGYETVHGNYSGHYYAKETQELLVKFHRWIFPDCVPGADHKKFPSVGVFPSIGFYPGQHWPAPINHFKPMEVYAHGAHDFMLYSPNDCHIAIDRAAPYGACWVAARDGNRVCIAKMIVNVANDKACRNFPEFNDYFSLATGCRNLDEYTEKLKAKAPSIDKRCYHIFAPIAQAIQDDDEIAFKTLFDDLPYTFQQAIYKNIWQVKGSPLGIHDDFGRLSFEGSANLKQEHIATKEEKINAIIATHRQIYDDLIEAPLHLLLAKEDLQETMAPSRAIAAPIDDEKGFTSVHEVIDELRDLIIQNKDATIKKEAIHKLDQVAALTMKKQSAVSHKLFELIYLEHVANKDMIAGYIKPTHSNFGMAAFYGEDHQRTEPEIILQALAMLESKLNDIP